MAGRESAWLIPPIANLRRNWIAHAEVSAAAKGWAVSLYQYDEFEYAEFSRRMPLPDKLVALDRTLRDTFEFDPRRWTKVGYDEAGFKHDWSQYFVIDQRNHYPIATLRLGLKRLGLANTSRLEPAFVCALERPDTLWALIAKWDGDSVSPRLSCRIAPDGTAPLLAGLAANGFLSAGDALALGELAMRFVTSPYLFVSLDPATPGAVAIDAEWPDPRVTPPDVHVDHRVDSQGIRYLKFRLGPDGEPQWTFYRPLAEVLSDETFEALVARPSSVREGAKEYYDRNNEAILSAVGPIYQAGLIGQRGTPESTMRNLIAAAGIQAGERIADLGCGAGGPAILIGRLVEGTRVDGITISPEQALAAHSLAQANGVDDRVTIQVGDYHEAPLASGIYDRVVFFESIGYADDLNQVLREAHRLLRAGGFLYIKDVVR
ncbi:MAG TPA: class I SAM-dependent methyltransferase, partial [Fimbriimonadaceae bacterium]|nr:class I SAM-dependent methyltransferase [Fimbriimonadaceae bacterium]